MTSINLANEVDRINDNDSDRILGKGLRMPNSASNSGSRKLMYGVHSEHNLAILNAENPYLQTGYEKRFGEESSSFIQTQVNMEVLGTVPKFSNIPKHHFYLIAVEPETGIMRVFERKEYKHITENYGYLFNNDYLDSLDRDNEIPAGMVIQKSMAFDEYNNRMDGCNLLTMYSSCEETMEDAIVISESAAKKMASPLIKKVEVIINDNDIPLNLYGDANVYKTFPDIGEETKNSTLCALRREKKEEILFSQSHARLRDVAISDEKYTVAGRVVDIDIYCNAPDKLPEFQYNKQLKYYYDEKIRMSREIVELIDFHLSQGLTMDYDLQRLYSNCRGILEKKQYYSEGVFSNIVAVFTVIEEIPVLRGDKLSNRYGGKGIIARVRPDALMPKTLYGDTVDLILNMCGVYGRENAGQLFEVTINYISMKLIQFMQSEMLDVSECVELYLKLLNIVSPSMAEYTEEFLSHMSDDDVGLFISSITCAEKSMYLVTEPMSENMTLDKVKQLYEEFSWIKPEVMMMPIVDSAGEIKYVPSRRPMIYGYQYIYRLKQYAEEKFSVTSLSATNIRNENSKSKSSNNYKALYSRTPIRFGDMETGNLIHLGAELVVQMLMLYSTSPHARRLTQQMLTGDAFDIDIKLDMESKNRNVEILNVYLKTMGLRLKFSRIPKKLEQPIYIEPMYFFDDPNRLVEGIIFMDKREKFDLDKEVDRLLKDRDGPVWGMEFYPMEWTRMDNHTKYLSENFGKGNDDGNKTDNSSSCI